MSNVKCTGKVRVRIFEAALFCFCYHRAAVADAAAAAITKQQLIVEKIQAKCYRVKLRERERKRERSE